MNIEKTEPKSRATGKKGRGRPVKTPRRKYVRKPKDDSGTPAQSIEPVVVPESQSLVVEVEVPVSAVTTPEKKAEFLDVLNVATASFIVGKQPAQHKAQSLKEILTAHIAKLELQLSAAKTLAESL